MWASTRTSPTGRRCWTRASTATASCRSTTRTGRSSTIPRSIRRWRRRRSSASRRTAPRRGRGSTAWSPRRRRRSRGCGTTRRCSCPRTSTAPSARPTAGSSTSTSPGSGDEHSDPHAHATAGVEDIAIAAAGELALISQRDRRAALAAGHDGHPIGPGFAEAHGVAGDVRLDAVERIAERERGAAGAAHRPPQTPRGAGAQDERGRVRAQPVWRHAGGNRLVARRLLDAQLPGRQAHALGVEAALRLVRARAAVMDVVELPAIGRGRDAAVAGGVHADRRVLSENRVRRGLLERAQRTVRGRIADAVLGRLPVVGGVRQVVRRTGAQDARALLPAAILLLAAAERVVVDVRVLPRLLVVVIVDDGDVAVAAGTGWAAGAVIGALVGGRDRRHGPGRGVRPPGGGERDGDDVRLLDVLAEVGVPVPVAVCVA